MNKTYMLCLCSGNYDVDLGSSYNVENELMAIIDNLVNLLQMYNIEDEEIIESIKEDWDFEITKIED